MKHCKFWVRVVCFVCVLSLLMIKYFDLIMPEFYSDSWPITSTFEGFYNLEKDSVDVLFLGSSHGASGFMPQELYNNYGITSYNLSSEQQNLLISYYWLREALKTQSPKVVVLECFITFPFNQEFVLNTEEACTRKSIDAMKWSKNKIELVNDVCRIDETQQKLSYYFPNLRYHKRWEELNVMDFTHDEMMEYAKLMGSYAIYYNCNKQYDGLDLSGVIEEEQMVPIMEEYLDKIVALCIDNNVKLLFSMNPTSVIKPGQCIRFANYAKSKGIAYIDFNDQNIYRSLNFNFEEDNGDIGHQNIRGARKVTNYIGQKLVADYGLVAHTDEQWEANKTFYSDKINECTLRGVYDIDEYLDLIKSQSLSVFITIKDEGTMCLQPSTQEKLAALGLKEELLDKYRCSYAAAIDKGNVVFEQLGNEAIEHSLYIRDGVTYVKLRSEGFDCGNDCSIEIDGVEKSKQSRGINIVVYSSEKREVIDSVVFDTCIQGCPGRK